MPLSTCSRLVLRTVLLCVAAIPTARADESPDAMRSLLPGDLKWGANKSAPPGMMIAPVYGDAHRPGLFIFRVKVPAGYRLPPHRHPDERTVTVLSGTYYSGVGERFDPAKLTAYPAGSFYVTPAGVPHFSYVESGETIIQESGMGPNSGIEYVDPADDPRPH